MQLPVSELKTYSFKGWSVKLDLASFCTVYTVIDEPKQQKLQQVNLFLNDTRNMCFIITCNMYWIAF